FKGVFAAYVFPNNPPLSVLTGVVHHLGELLVNRVRDTFDAANFGTHAFTVVEGSGDVTIDWVPELFDRGRSVLGLAGLDRDNGALRGFLSQDLPNPAKRYLFAQALNLSVSGAAKVALDREARILEFSSQEDFAGVAAGIASH